MTLVDLLNIQSMVRWALDHPHGRSYCSIVTRRVHDDWQLEYWRSQRRDFIKEPHLS